MVTSYFTSALGQIPCSTERIASYTNDLHDALLAKNGPTFWKCWPSKFETSVDCTEVVWWICGSRRDCK